MQFALGFIKNLFDVPTSSIERSNYSRRKVIIGGQELKGLATEWAPIMNATNRLAADMHQMVVLDTGIDRILWIVTEFSLFRQIHILFGTTDKINAMSVLPFGPLLRVDAGTIPYPQDFAAAGRPLPEGFDLKSLERMHVVLLLATIGTICGSQLKQCMRPEIKTIKMA